MTRKEYKNWEAKADLGTISDSENPAFILSSTNTILLTQIAKGELNMQELAKRMLENRGLDINGQWVGFGKEIN